MPVVDDAILDGIVAKWDADASLVALIPDSSRYVDYAPSRPGWKLPVPYAIIELKQDRPPDKASPVQSGRKYVDYTRATITAYCQGRASAVEVLGALRTTFKEYGTLTLSAGTWMRTQYVSDEVERDPARRHGEDTYRAILVVVVWSEQAEP